MKCEYDPSRLDHLRRQTTVLADEIAKLRLQLANERYARLTAEMMLAIARGDQVAWAAALAAREDRYQRTTKAVDDLFADVREAVR